MHGGEKGVGNVALRRRFADELECILALRDGSADAVVERRVVATGRVGEGDPESSQLVNCAHGIITGQV